MGQFQHILKLSNGFRCCWLLFQSMGLQQEMSLSHNGCYSGHHSYSIGMPNQTWKHGGNHSNSVLIHKYSFSRATWPTTCTQLRLEHIWSAFAAVLMCIIHTIVEVHPCIYLMSSWYTSQTALLAYSPSPTPPQSSVKTAACPLVAFSKLVPPSIRSFHVPFHQSNSNHLSRLAFYPISTFTIGLPSNSSCCQCSQDMTSTLGPPD